MYGKNGFGDPELCATQHVRLKLHSMHAHRGNQSVVLHANELTPVQDVYYNQYNCIASNKWKHFSL